jgi:hypothetical protein
VSIIALLSQQQPDRVPRNALSLAISAIISDGLSVPRVGWCCGVSIAVCFALPLRRPQDPPPPITPPDIDVDTNALSNALGDVFAGPADIACTDTSTQDDDSMVEYYHLTTSFC